MITTFTGPMHSGKTAEILSTYNKIWNKEHLMMFKPKCDTRSVGAIKSNSFSESIEAIEIDTFDEIISYIKNDTTAVFIDEAQMFKGNIHVLTYLSLICDVDVYLSGLNMTSEQEPFMIMPFVLAISDKVVNIPASCFDCGRDATYTYFEGTKTEDLKIGNEGYIPLCGKCLVKRSGKEIINKLILNKKN